MSFPSFDDLLLTELDRLKSAHLLRSHRVITPLDAVHVELDGRRYVNFSSNNYLGLTHHPLIREAIIRAVQTHGCGSGAAGLITGHSDLHEQAEQDLARWKGTESAVLFPSGYQANLAAISALATLAEHPGPSIGKVADSPDLSGVRFLLDKLVHASLIDAVRATGLPFRVFPHNHLGKLERLLDDAPPRQLQVVVTESIFSMDGDAADLVGITNLRTSRDFVLLVDEAHASGVYGPNGSGLSTEQGVCHQVNITVVTMSKALGVAGGAVCASRAFCDLILNKGRPYIFSTSVPPGVAAGTSAALKVMRDEPERQHRVRLLSKRVRDELAGHGVDLPPGDSPIIPILLGESVAAIRAAEKLREAGCLALPIRPPTVAPGSSRLRVTLSSEHSDQEAAGVVQAIKSAIQDSTS